MECVAQFSKQEYLFGAIGEEEHGFLLGIGRRGEHGMMTCGMEAQHDLAAGRSFQAQPLGADGHAAIRADFERGAHAPHIVPPGAAGRGAQGRTLFFPRLIPGSLRGLAQFPMDFVGVVMRPQGVDVPVGDFDFQNLFAGEVGGQPSLPELVFAFDFALGLGRGGIAQADVVELECPAQLRQRVGIVREKDAVVIDVELQRASVGQESGGEEVEVGEQEFALIEFGAGEEAAAIIEHVEHGVVKGAVLTIDNPVLFERRDVGPGLSLSIVRTDPFPIGGNNYRLFHDALRGKMIFIPGGLDQLFVVSSAPNYSLTPVFKGLVAKNLFNIPEARQRYWQRIESLSTNEFRVAALHARVDQLAKEAIAGLPKNHAARSQIEEGAEFLKARITSRAQFVAQQLVAPARPVQLAGPSELKLVNWTYKGGAPLPAASSRLMQGNRQILRVTGRGPGSTGAWRSTLLLGAGRYEFTGLARTEGIMAQPGETNGVILRISGERSAEGITVTDEWKSLRYEFEVSGVEDVELICEFRGAQGMGWFDVSTLRLARLARE